MLKKILIFIILAALSGCSLSPGMHMRTNQNFGSDQEYVYIDSIQENIEIIYLSDYKTVSPEANSAYRIGDGDQIVITVWGLPEIFPPTSVNIDSNLRRVDSNGNMYFPYVGLIKARGKTQNELRKEVEIGLSKFFTNPQIDLSIARYNSQNVFLLGEVIAPMKINLTDIPLTLSQALGEAKGLNPNTANGSDVFVIRSNSSVPIIFRADLSSPSGFFDASNFFLEHNDIVFVNAKSTARWNKVISQFFPFSTFLNSVDNLTSD